MPRGCVTEAGLYNLLDCVTSLLKLARSRDRYRTGFGQFGAVFLKQQVANAQAVAQALEALEASGKCLADDQRNVFDILAKGGRQVGRNRQHALRGLSKSLEGYGRGNDRLDIKRGGRCVFKGALKGLLGGLAAAQGALQFRLQLLKLAGNLNRNSQEPTQGGRGRTSEQSRGSAHGFDRRSELAILSLSFVQNGINRGAFLGKYPQDNWGFSLLRQSLPSPLFVSSGLARASRPEVPFES